jgi:hypothetical protein
MIAARIRFGGRAIFTTEDSTRQSRNQNSKRNFTGEPD